MYRIMLLTPSIFGKVLRRFPIPQVSGAFESTLPSGSEKKNLPNVVKPLSQEEIWDRRQKLSRPSIQRFEKPAPKVLLFRCQ